MWTKQKKIGGINPQFYKNKPNPKEANEGSVHLIYPKTDARLIIGHRGSSFRYPENTYLAFDKAFEEGANAIEIDVWKTVDNQLVVIHDDTVNRTTNGSGVVSALTWDYISSLDAGSWKGAEFTGRNDVKIPLFSDLLERYKGRPVFISVQIKLGYNEVMDCIDIIEQKGMMHQCFIFTDRGALKQVKQNKPQAFVMNDGFDSPEGLLNQAISENWDAISTSPTNITTQLTQRAHENSTLVQASTISSNFAQQTQQCIDKGVNFMLGNDCSEMVGVLKSNGLTQIVPFNLNHLGLKIMANGQWVNLN